MDCTEARRLIDAGVQPGTRSHQSTQLGFHLVKCAECRAYHEHQQQLLSQLLFHMPDQTAPPPTSAGPSQQQSGQTTSPVGATAPQRADSTTSTTPRPSEKANTLTRLLWIGSICLLIGLPLGFLIWFAGVLVRTDRNIEAMVLPITPSSTTQPDTAMAENLSAALPTIELANQATGTALAATEMALAMSPERATATVTPLPTETVPTPIPLPPTAVPPTPEPPPPGNAVNVLLLGSDRRPDEVDPSRTDAVMVLRVEPYRQRIALLSLPRDLWVEIPGYGFNRINAAHVWGEAYGAAGGGIGLARDTVSTLLGIHIDYVALVDFQGFIGLVDTLGGIPVNVETELYDTRFPTMDYGYTEVHFLPGLQQMDGVTALSYSRIRHPDSDFMRIRRQQEVLVGIGTRIRKRGDLQNLVTVDQMTESLRDFVRTDMPKERIIGLIWAMRDLDISQVERYTLGSDGVSFGVGNDAYALVASPPVLENLIRQFMGVPQPAE